MPALLILLKLFVVVLTQLGPDRVGEDLNFLISDPDKLLSSEDRPHNLLVGDVVEVDAWVPARVSLALNLEQICREDEQFSLLCILYIQLDVRNCWAWHLILILQG